MHSVSSSRRRRRRRRFTNKNKNQNKNQRMSSRRRHNGHGGNPLHSDRARTLQAQLQQPGRTSSFLKRACGPQTHGICIDAGRYSSMIESFFDSFTNLSLMRMLKPIATEGDNGFVLRAMYTKEKYTAFTALKFPQTKESDNLMYEYLVGKKFINQYISRFPCFVKTYNVFELISEEAKLAYSDDFTPAGEEVVADDELVSYLSLINDSEMTLEELLTIACTKSNLLCIQIQHFQNFKSFSDIFADDVISKQENVRLDLFSSLFQVYFTLSRMMLIYTHYDLHRGNVFLYTPFPDGYIEFFYHYEDGTVISFLSQHIVKIIDYGRNFFNCNLDESGNPKKTATTRSSTKVTSSAQIINKVCKMPVCVTEAFRDYWDPSDVYDDYDSEVCGRSFGFDSVTSFTNQFHNIISSRLNVSHDLRLAKLFESFLINEGILKNIVYTGKKGTEPVKKSSFSLYGDQPKKVSTVHDMEIALKIYLHDTKNAFASHMNPSLTKYAEMHVYEDTKPYEFIMMNLPENKIESEVDDEGEKEEAVEEEEENPDDFLKYIYYDNASEEVEDVDLKETPSLTAGKRSRPSTERKRKKLENTSKKKNKMSNKR